MNLKERVNFSIYLLKNLTPKTKNYRDYFKDLVNADRNLERYFLDKRNITGLENKRDKQGEIYVLKKQTNAADWVNQLNKISRGKIQGQNRTNDKGILFIECCNRVLAISFGKGITMVQEEYIERNFGLRVSQSLLEIDKLGKINSLMIGESHYNLRKYSNSYIPINRLTSDEDLSILSNINGETPEGFSIGGGDSISFSGKINFNTDLMQILNNFMNAYVVNSNSIKLDSNITLITDKEYINNLDRDLGEKILKMKEYFKIKFELNGKILRNIEMNPRPILDMDHIDYKKYGISGIGLKEPMEKLDKLIYFEKFSRYLMVQDIEDPTIVIQKLKEHKIKAIYTDDGEDITIALGKIYENISCEIRKKFKTHILIRGSWYLLDEDFLQSLKDEINNIPTHQTNVNFGQFDKTYTTLNSKNEPESREGLYNDDIARKHNYIDNFDEAFYEVNQATRRKYNIGVSKVEPCDLYFEEHEKYKFVHVKKYKKPGDISHLLVQGYASAVLLVNHEDYFNHVNSIIQKGPSLIPPIRTNDVEVVFALIVRPRKYKQTDFSSVFPILSMLSIVNTVRSIKKMGFNCSIQLIQDVTKK